MAEMIPDQQGRVRYIKPANPAAGVDFVITQEARVRWELKSLRYKFVASATVANRSIKINIADAVITLTAMHGLVAHVANSTKWYQWERIGSGYIGYGADLKVQPLPEGVRYNDGITISSSTGSMQVADQISDIVLVVEEWIEPLE